LGVMKGFGEPWLGRIGNRPVVEPRGADDGAMGISGDAAPEVSVRAENATPGGRPKAGGGIVDVAAASRPRPGEGCEDEEAEPEGLPFVDGARGHVISWRGLGWCFGGC